MTFYSLTKKERSKYKLAQVKIEEALGFKTKQVIQKQQFVRKSLDVSSYKHKSERKANKSTQERNSKYKLTDDNKVDYESKHKISQQKLHSYPFFKKSSQTSQSKPSRLQQSITKSSYILSITEPDQDFSKLDQKLKLLNQRVKQNCVVQTNQRPPFRYNPKKY